MPWTKRKGRPSNWRQLEKWKPLKGYEDLYFISNMGRIKQTHRTRHGVKQQYTRKIRYLSPSLTNDMPTVGLTDNQGKRTYHQVKNLVADNWLQPRHPGTLVEWRHRELFEDCSVYNIKEKGYTRWKNQKLTPEERDYIRDKIKKEYYRGIQADLARQFGLTKMAITQIKHQSEENNYK